MLEEVNKTATNQTVEFDFTKFAHAYAPLPIEASLKSFPEDFIVEEQLGYDLCGEGEHIWLWIEKKQQNSDWVAQQLARWLHTAVVNIGYAGQKDRQAITRQWFSVPCGINQQLDLSSFQCEGVRILEAKRHDKKLRRGELAGNRFTITLRDMLLTNDAEAKPSLKLMIEQRLQQLQQGVPNYYGMQRFGKQGNNLRLGAQLLAQDNRDRNRNSRGKKQRNTQRNQQSMAISAIRSWMFNSLLSERVQAGNWDKAIDGDLVTDGVAADLPNIVEDLSAQTDNYRHAPVVGTLFGDADLRTQNLAYEFESKIIEQFQNWYQGLRSQRVQPGYRAFKLLPENLQCQWLTATDDAISATLQLEFELPAGCFATMLLRELCGLKETERRS